MRSLILVLTLLWVTPAAAWTLNGELSGLSFGSVKKGDVGEVHHFTGLSGTVAEGGQATVAIDLASVETWLDIRNERMREFLFETGKYPQATISATIPLAEVAKAKPGAVTTLTTPITLSLHGHSVTFAADLVVTPLGEGRVMVTPGELIMLDANKFNMAAGIRKLMELAELPSISAAVPVTFRLVFDAAPQ